MRRITQIALLLGANASAYFVIPWVLKYMHLYLNPKLIADKFRGSNGVLKKELTQWYTAAATILLVEFLILSLLLHLVNCWYVGHYFVARAININRITLLVVVLMLSKLVLVDFEFIIDKLRLSSQP